MDEPFHIDYGRDGDLLRAHVTGVNGTLGTTMAYWAALAAELRRDPGVKALLVVDDMEGEPPPPEQLAQFVQAMVGLGFEGVPVAYVEAHAEQIPAVEFGEILARVDAANDFIDVDAVATDRDAAFPRLAEGILLQLGPEGPVEAREVLDQDRPLGVERDLDGSIAEVVVQRDRQADRLAGRVVARPAPEAELHVAVSGTRAETARRAALGGDERGDRPAREQRGLGVVARLGVRGGNEPAHVSAHVLGADRRPGPAHRAEAPVRGERRQLYLHATA